MTIRYQEKGFAMHTAIHAAGHWLREEDGVWVSSDDAAVQAIIDAYDPLPEARRAKWLEVQAERDRRKGAGVSAGGYLFHSDPDSRIQQLGLVMMGASMPPGLMWKTLGGQFAPMTPTLALQLFQATAASDQAIFAAAEAHRAAIDALTDRKAVETYDFSGGWPQG